MGTTAGIVVSMYESMISCAPATKALYPESPTPYVPTIDSASLFLLFFYYLLQLIFWMTLSVSFADHFHEGLSAFSYVSSFTAKCLHISHLTEYTQLCKISFY
ncbi:hypothetical protein BDV30DRAFT_201566 [Aspergillus minisclerotigenes]|uniref:Uncharacterized protein n=1 Tax=Aspergillus minisclerotigenes TaxID=656917 RepID=A0A5N6JNL9_9EURO|nr:hypothetical protein BDV30DRAFT_201566 [Aspergillus minisclerotigenes]